jgi:hypothetical protein
MCFDADGTIGIRTTVRTTFFDCSRNSGSTRVRVTSEKLTAFLGISFAENADASQGFCEHDHKLADQISSSERFFTGANRTVLAGC